MLVGRIGISLLDSVCLTLFTRNSNRAERSHFSFKDDFSCSNTSSGISWIFIGVENIRDFGEVRSAYKTIKELQYQPLQMQQSIIEPRLKMIGIICFVLPNGDELEFLLRWRCILVHVPVYCEHTLQKQLQTSNDYKAINLECKSKD